MTVTAGAGPRLARVGTVASTQPRDFDAESTQQSGEPGARPASPARRLRASESFEVEAFEVAGLGDAQEDGVVAGLREAIGDPGANAGIGGGLAADFLEERLRDVMGA